MLNFHIQTIQNYLISYLLILFLQHFYSFLFILFSYNNFYNIYLFSLILKFFLLLFILPLFSHYILLLYLTFTFYFSTFFFLYTTLLFLQYLNIHILLSLLLNYSSFFNYKILINLEFSFFISHLSPVKSGNQYISTFSFIESLRYTVFSLDTYFINLILSRFYTNAKIYEQLQVNHVLRRQKTRKVELKYLELTPKTYINYLIKYCIPFSII